MLTLLGSPAEWFPDVGSADGSQSDAIHGELVAEFGACITQLAPNQRLLVQLRVGRGHVTAQFMMTTQADSVANDSAMTAFQAVTQRYFGATGWRSADIDSASAFVQLRPTVPQDGVRRNMSGAWNTLRPSTWSEVVDRLVASPFPLELITEIESVAVRMSDVSVAMRRARRHEARSSVRTHVSQLRAAAASPNAVKARLLVSGAVEQIAVVMSLLNSSLTDGQSISCVAATNPVGGSLANRIDALAGGELIDSTLAATLLPLPILDSSNPVRAERRTISRYNFAPEFRNRSAVRLGRSESGAPYGVPVADLAQHLLVTGNQGFGKSTTVRTLLQALFDNHGIPSLIVDPIKSDYSAMTFGGGGRIRTITLGPDARINPLAVPDGVSPDVYAATLAECFDSATGLSESFPLGMAVMRNAFQRVYEQWRIDGESTGWPTLAHLYSQVMQEIVRQGGRHETAANLRASLLSRLDALTTGANADALAGGPRSGIDWAELLRVPTLLSLRNLADETSRAAAFSFVTAGLMSYRRAHPQANVAHVTVLEEAHMLMRPEGGSARAVAEALATQRAFGQAYILVTQVPRQLPEVVFDLFPSRITHRLAAGEAAEKVASSMGGCNPLEINALRNGEVLALNANGYHQPTKVIVEAHVQSERPAGTAFEGSFDIDAVIEPSPPERVWCTECPSPCKGREWLKHVPHAISIDGLEPAPAELRATRVARQIISTAQADAPIDRLDDTTVRVRLYCSVARSLTILNSFDLSASRHGMVVARRVADNVASSLRARRSTQS